MAVIFWDASGLIKRYLTEAGGATVNVLFDDGGGLDHATAPIGYIETYAALLRKCNGGVLNRAEFETAALSLQAEVIYGPEFGLMSISDRTIFAAADMIHRHNLSATDAAILTMLLEHARADGMPPILLIAADQRLLRAASAEGLAALDPERVAPGEVPARLAAL